MTGRLSEIPVDLGSSVEKGQPIAWLDTTDFQLRVRQAEAALQQARVRLGLSIEESDSSVEIEKTAIARQARAEMDGARSRVERAKQLFDKGLLPKADFDSTDSSYKVAEAIAYSLIDDWSDWLHTRAKASLAQRSLKSSM